MRLEKIVIFIYTLLFSSIFFLLLSIKDIYDLAYGKKLPLETGGLFFIGVIILLCFFKISNMCPPFFLKMINRYSGRLRIIFTIVLIIIQIILCYSAYFISGWDPGIIKETVLQEIMGEYSKIDQTYYSWYPNNLLLVWVFTCIVKPFYNIISIDQLEFLICIFQCIIDGLVVWLIYDIAYKISDSCTCAWATYFMYVLFVGISPWFIVPYSDSTGILFPVMIVWLYTRIKRDSKRQNMIVAIAIGVVSNFGMHIKPQAIIVLIAIVINELMIFIRKKTRLRALKEMLIFFTGIMSAFMIMNIIYINLIIPQLKIEINDELSVGPAHYMMMGLNNITNGGYLDSDRIYSVSFDNRVERSKADLQECERRLNDYGVIGLAKHLCKKTLINYGDGTFAWAEEGTFIKSQPTWANTRLSHFLREIVYPNTQYYMCFILVKQLMWLIILGGMPCVYVVHNNINCEKDAAIFVMCMSVIGLTLFQLIFEARARYLFCYSPLYVLLGIYGITKIYGKVVKKGME